MLLIKVDALLPVAMAAYFLPVAMAAYFVGVEGASVTAFSAAVATIWPKTPAMAGISNGSVVNRKRKRHLLDQDLRRPPARCEPLHVFSRQSQAH